VSVPSDESNCDNVNGVLLPEGMLVNVAEYEITSPRDDPTKAIAENEPARTPACFKMILRAIRSFFFLAETGLGLFIDFSPSERI
jgi:hypothetical protein